MKKVFNSYFFNLFWEAIGANEALSQKCRYEKFAGTIKIFSQKMSDEEIWNFYQYRHNSNKNIKNFLSFLFAFIFVMAYMMSNNLLYAIIVGSTLFLLYTPITRLIKQERNHSHLWDDKTLFMRFLTLNRSEIFVPKEFDKYIYKTEEISNTLTFEDEILILSKEKNIFNEVPIVDVINFFNIIRVGDKQIQNGKRIIISDGDFIRFIRHRFIKNDSEILHIKLLNGDIGSVKALFYVFYNNYSTALFERTKKGKRGLYISLYNKSFAIVRSNDIDNFSDVNALDYSIEIKQNLKIS